MNYYIFIIILIIGLIILLNKNNIEYFNKIESIISFDSNYYYLNIITDSDFIIYSIPKNIWKKYF